MDYKELEKEKMRNMTDQQILSEYMYLVSLKEDILFNRDYVKLYGDELNKRRFNE